jgi:hypothetical protein
MKPRDESERQISPLPKLQALSCPGICKTGQPTFRRWRHCLAGYVTTRQLADGRRLVQVVRPVCDRRHWTTASNAVHECPRKPGGPYGLEETQT